MDKEFEKNSATHDLLKERIGALDMRLTVLELKVDQTKVSTEKTHRKLEEVLSQKKQLEGGWKVVQWIGFVVAGVAGWIINHLLGGKP